MEPLSQGDALIVVRHPAQMPTQHPAVFVRAEGSLIAVRFTGPVSDDWTHEEPVLISTGSAGQRAVVNGSFVKLRDGFGVFRAAAAWRRVESRQSARIRVDLQAEVRSVLGQSRQEGRVVDVSLGGLAVRVPVKPGGREIEVIVRFGGYGSSLPCRVVSVTNEDSAVLLHLEFQALTPPQKAFIRNLVGTLGTGREDRAAS
jgi:hypothetical protein